MNQETVLDNTIPSHSDGKSKILSNIVLLNHYLTDTINKLNDIRKNITLNVNALESINSQETTRQEINTSHMPELEKTRRLHHERMSSAFNDQGVL